ncbi:MAG: pilus assembly protein TadG-related protein [Acetobacteraceae bacterium]|nr:hypothetical protein [Pseudomonadota bacterium]
MIRCRKGHIATTAALALTGLAGLSALGSEASTWYYIKRNAQNAADAAAFAGALAITQRNAGNTSDSVTASGIAFANQNGYCTGGATSCTNSGAPVTVSVTRGTYASGAFTASGSGSDVLAVITQQQTGLLSGLIGRNSITIAASAVASVKDYGMPCVLATNGSVSFQGNSTVSAPTCAIVSNSTASNAISFNNNGNGSLSITAQSLAAAGGCSGNTSQCATNANYSLYTNVPPATNPFAKINAAVANWMTNHPSPSNCSGSNPRDWGTSTCVNKNTTISSPLTLNGTYFFSGNLTIKSGANLTGTATLIMLSGSSLTVQGNATINLTAQGITTTFPASQTPSEFMDGTTNLLNGLVLYDPESGTVSPNGTPSITLIGGVYAPNATWALSGNNSQSGSYCSEVVAYAVSLTGSSSFNAAACPANLQMKTQVVRLAA